jgi:hypothetical protein
MAHGSAASIEERTGPDSTPGSRPGDARSLFNGALEAFERACLRSGRVDSHYAAAGHRVAVACAGTVLPAALLPALGHLADTALLAAPDRSGLIICAWEGSSADVVPPAPAWRDAGYLGNTELPEYADGPVRAAFDSYLGMLSLYDVERQLALFWLRDASHVPITLVGTPFRIILQWWAAQHDAQLVHAAAVGTRHGAAVISGPSGAGKSTTALAALESGLLYLGDDFVLVKAGPAPEVCSLYCSAKVDDATLATRFPSLRDAVHRRRRLEHEKEVLFVGQRSIGRTTAALPLRAILLPHVTGRDVSRLVRVGPGDALRSLLPGIFPFPGQRHEAVSRLARLTRQVPAYRLELGHEGAEIARTLQAFLDTFATEHPDDRTRHP